MEFRATADQRLIQIKEAGRAAVPDDRAETNALLKVARQLGCFDMFGGALVSLVKVSKPDQVRRQTHELTRALHPFGAEYGNVGRELQQSVDPDGWNRTGDILADNLSIDVATQSRIDRAISTVGCSGEIVVPIVGELAAQVELLTNDLSRESDGLGLFLEWA